MKKILITSIVICMHLFVVVCLAWSGNWWVDPVSGDDSYNGDDPLQPFQHIWKALDEASSSDYIYLKSGDYYNEDIRPITINIW